MAADITPAHLRAFTLACVNHLVHDKRIPLSQLARHEYPLMQRLSERIATLRDESSKSAFTQLVLDGGWDLEASSNFAFRFEANRYPVPGHRRYSGKFSFGKHYYPVLADLRDNGEEFQSAVAIDRHPRVVRWARNLDSDPENGFWLPTASGRFYPEFVCELDYQRLLVVEYKGEHLRNVPKEIQKGQVGKLWAQRSGGRALFAVVFKEDRGLNVSQQLDAALSRP